MESRYALRELQGVIGIDLRRLDDGRSAVFRHTGLHKKIKRDYFERRDVMLVLHASFMSVASVASHARMDIRKAIEVVAEDRSMFIKIAFPYIDVDKSETRSNEEYDKYFDELDEIIAKRKSNSENGDAAVGSKDAVGEVGGK